MLRYVVLFFLIVFIYYYLLLLAVLGLHCCGGGLSLVSDSGGYFPVEVCGLLITVASLVAEHRL